MEWGLVPVHETGGICVSPKAGSFSLLTFSQFYHYQRPELFPGQEQLLLDFVPEPGNSFFAGELTVALTSLLPPSSLLIGPLVGKASMNACSEAVPL